MIRDYETIREIMTNLPDDVYYLTAKAYQYYFAYGDADLLKIAAEQSGLTEDEIIWWY